MSDTIRICGYLGLNLTPWQLWACEFLENQGQRFLVDFGYENAEAIAEALKMKWWESDHD